MKPSSGETYRTTSGAERLVAILPSGGIFGAMRRRLRGVFAWWIGRGGLVSALPGGEVVRVSGQYRHITWNPVEYSAFRAAVRPGDVVLEAGANVGAYTVLFAQWVGPSGRVIAFEPEPSAFAGLTAHITLNAVADRVDIVRAAVSDGSVAQLRFAAGESSGLGRVVGEQEAAPSPLIVDAVSIDGFCAERGLSPRIIKIDVEGAELAALRGARTAIAAAGQELQLFVEMHPAIWPSIGITESDIRHECDLQGLSSMPLDSNTDDPWTREGVCVRLRPRAR